MNGDRLHCKALDKTNVSMAMAERIGLRGYSMLSYAIFSQKHAHGWIFIRKGNIEIIRVESEVLDQLYPEDPTGRAATLV
ncbi:MAG: hypothetical protein IPK63_06665 [Candidatus Competibacteraceae bacterium]|nr:hypothetical protein [Candidatus Competibacteraceae bacterium]